MRQSKQLDAMRALFKSRPNQWIPLYEIMDLRIGQYNVRIKQLRDDEGMNIVNDQKSVNGVTHSRYMWVTTAQMELAI